MKRKLSLAACGIKESDTGLFTAFRDYLIDKTVTVDTIRRDSAYLAQAFMREFLKERGHAGDAAYNFCCGYIVE